VHINTSLEKLSILRDFMFGFSQRFQKYAKCFRYQYCNQNACILSTGAYVPTIGIAYLFKVKEYMNDIGLGDFCVDIEYFEHKKVFMMFEEMWNRKQEICDNLQNIIEKKKVQLLESLNEIDSIMLYENPSYK